MKMDLGSNAVNFVNEFMASEKLPASYAHAAQHYFVPLASRIQRLIQKMDRVPVIGINGGQGTGKATCSALIAGLVEVRGVRALVGLVDGLYFF